MRRAGRTLSRSVPNTAPPSMARWFARMCGFSLAGEMVAVWWDRIRERFEGVRLDAFMVMPTHVHGVILIDHGEAGRQE